MKQRLRRIYDTLSKFLHESRDDVIIDLSNESLSRADVVGLACFLKKYAVTYQVRDGAKADVTSEYS